MDPGEDAAALRIRIGDAHRPVEYRLGGREPLAAAGVGRKGRPPLLGVEARVVGLRSGKRVVPAFEEAVDHHPLIGEQLDEVRGEALTRAGGGVGDHGRLRVPRLAEVDDLARVVHPRTVGGL